MTNRIYRILCKICGPSEGPCEHVKEALELEMLRELRAQNKVALTLIESTLLEVIHEQRQIIHLLNRPISATLRLQTENARQVKVVEQFQYMGDAEGYFRKSRQEQEMSATVQVGGSATAVFKEFTGPNGTGTEVPPGGPVNFTSDHPEVATVDANGLVTAVASGTASITGQDTTNNLSASDVLTVAAPQAVSATLTLTANA